MFAAFGPGAALTLAGSTAASETRDIVERGGTAEQAALGGFAAGTAEYIFEKMGIDSLLDLKYVKNPEDWLKRALKQGGVEAGGETLTAVSHILTDTAIMGDDSRFERLVDHYRGMKKAQRTPVLRQKMDELKTNLRGFLSGLKGAGYAFEVNGNILEARLYDTGIREVMEKVTKDKASMLYHSREVFQKAHYLYSTPDYGGDSNIYRWNYFYAPVQIGDDIVGVRIAIRDIRQSEIHTPESQIYHWGIKKDAVLGGERPSTKPPSFGASSTASDDIKP